uniref:Uncharacterized protein n=1 Tax=Aegilops tauschii subsp. strangulata TaxID=200361 RepID=A0A453IIC1_AEGTS
MLLLGRLANEPFYFGAGHSFTASQTFLHSSLKQMYTSACRRSLFLGCIMLCCSLCLDLGLLLRHSRAQCLWFAPVLT